MKKQKNAGKLPDTKKQNNKMAKTPVHSCRSSVLWVTFSLEAMSHDCCKYRMGFNTKCVSYNLQEEAVV